MRYDFAFFFVALTLLTGGIWLLDSLLFAPARRRMLALLSAYAETRAKEHAIALEFNHPLVAEQGFDSLLLVTGPDGTAMKGHWELDNYARKVRFPFVKGAEKYSVHISGRLAAADDRMLGADLDRQIDTAVLDHAIERREPLIVEYSRSFFPVILIILLVRSFLGEPYRIPSGSMMPTLLIGDFILVNKFAYGLRLPVLDTKIVPIGEPARGDVIVFHPPHHPEQSWIKRVIGLPGDTIAYDNYILTINGHPVPTSTIGPYLGKGSGRDMTGWRELRETLPERSHLILQQDLPPMFQRANGVWTVPAGEYFMMGDNRDNSEDSRYWPTHFLPEKNIVGKAVVVWMNWDTGGDGIDGSRIGTVIK